jgi:acyl-CoA synthetase (NDP forming)/GNAT superfamily N-acetyltransferase
MSVRNLDKLFHPRSVALIGATEEAGSAGAVALRNLCRAGFAGEIMLVGRHPPSRDGVAVHHDIASLPRAPDLALLATAPAAIPDAVARLVARGTRAAILLGAGSGAPDGAGQSWHQAALDAARPHLLRLLGPDSLGAIVPRIGLDASVAHRTPLEGDIAFVSQSNAMIGAMIDWATPRGIGFSHIVGLGGQMDVDFGDMLDYLAADAGTRAILAYVEHLTHGRKFMSAARAAARGKPVLVLKAGRARIGGDDRVYDAVFRRAGMLRVRGLAELCDAAETLALTGSQAGDGLAILSNGGGAGLLAADALDSAGGRLAALSRETREGLGRVLPAGSDSGNPVVIRDDQPEHYAAALTALIADRSADAVLILHCPTAFAEPEATARAVVEAVEAMPAELRRGRNLFTAWLGEASVAAARRRFATARIAGYETPEAGVGGFLHRVEYQRNQRLLMETPPLTLDAFEPDAARVRGVVANALRLGRSRLDADETATVLAAYGVARSAGEVRSPHAVDLAVGLVEHPVFGPVVVFGQGGVAAEIVADRAAGLPPLNLPLARAQMAQTRIWHRLQAGRDRPAAAIDAIAEVLIRIGRLAAEQPEIREFEIDPLVADAAGAAAIHARIRVGAAIAAGAARLAIAPYPGHLACIGLSRDGTEVAMRPARPEDEPLLHDLAAHMSAEDLRLRFFTPIRGLTHPVAARLTQIDYDREMALLAEHGGTVLGIVHYFADPDRRRAEYAIAVRSDWHGRGVGYLLMTRLIEIARQYGIGELVGEVLRENGPMLEMCRSLGFTIASDPNDPAILLVKKPLAAGVATTPPS